MIDLYDYEEMEKHEKVLADWGPAYWKEFREMMANYAFAGWTLDLKAYLIYRWINNLFISTADEETISKYEKLFRITPTEGQSLEERRAIALLRFIGNQKISFSWIKNYIKDSIGADCDVSWEGDTGTTIRIRIYRDGNPIGNHNALYDAIRRKLPAQLGYDFQYANRILVSMKVKRTYWKHIFDLAGTIPTTNIGYQEGDSDMSVGVTPHGWAIQFKMCGDDSL